MFQVRGGSLGIGWLGLAAVEVAGCTGIVVLGRLVLGQAAVEAAGCTGFVVLTSVGFGGTCRAWCSDVLCHFAL